MNEATTARPVPRRPSGRTVRAADRLSRATGALSAVGLLTMTGIVAYEVFSRYLLNEPTYWSAEIATYLLVAITFLGLAEAQRSGDHVQVELLLAYLSRQRRAALET